MSPTSARRRARSRRRSAPSMSRSCFAEADFWRLLPQIVAGDRRSGRRLRDPADLGRSPGRRARPGSRSSCRARAATSCSPAMAAIAACMRPWWAGGRLPRARGMLDELGVLRGEIAGWRDGIAAAEAQDRRPGPYAAAGGAGGRLRRLAAERSVDQARSLPDGAWRRGPHAVSRPGAGGARLSPARRAQGQARARQMAACAAGSPITAAGAAAGPQARLHRAGGEWIARRADAIGPLVARSPAVREICRPDAVETLFAAAGQRRAGRAAWNLLFYALWHRRHIERAESAAGYRWPHSPVVS